MAMWVRVMVGLGLSALSAIPLQAAEPICTTLAGTPHLRPSPETVEGAVSHVYKRAGGTDLRVHVFAHPAQGTALRPAVVMLFGGGWMIGNVADFAEQARHIAARGGIAILADYRTYCRNGVKVDAEVEDARDAFLWVRGHARELGVDPRRIAMLGASSGGHLALSTAVFAGSDGGEAPVPALLLLFYPCVNLGNAVEQDFSSLAIGEFAEVLSPLFHVRPGLPRTYILQGTADPLYSEVKAYCAAARDAGSACTLSEYADAPHGFFNALRKPRTADYDRGLAEMDAILTKEGWLVPAR